MHMVVKFDKENFKEVIGLLLDRDCTMSTFVSSIEAHANHTKQACTRCDRLLGPEDTKCGESDQLYGFVAISDEGLLAHVVGDLLLNGFTRISIGPTQEELLKDLRIQCKECLTKVEPSHARMIDQGFPRNNIAQISSVYGQCGPSDVKDEKPQLIESKPDCSGASLAKKRKLDRNEDETAAEMPDDDDDTNNQTTGDFTTLIEENPDYQWVKCKMCARILRTKRFDNSRMRTLKSSHARNHVSKPQFQCNGCSFECRFSGGIQLHMSRMHPNDQNNFTDLSRNDRYRELIDETVVKCFGEDNLPRKKYITKRRMPIQPVDVSSIVRPHRILRR